MKKAIAAAAISLALIGAACDSFIQGPGLTENPNSPTGGTIQQQLISLQAALSVQFEGQLARTAGMFTQQIIGSNNQQLQQGTQYNTQENDISAFMSRFYTGGGLLGLRNLQTGANAAGDKFLEGVGNVLEGFEMGTATSLWGDLPYSEALKPEILTPKLDTQQDIYTEVQKRLDAGIALLKAAPTTGVCETADLFYCATGVTRATEINRWVAAANTMKARFYLDLVERNGNAAYTLALAAAQQGIGEAPTSAANAMIGAGPGDFRTFHGSTQDVDGNIWGEFLSQRQDIVAGDKLVSLMKARNDTRLSNYFDANAQGLIIGMDQNAKVIGGSAASVINTTIRRSFTFRQPLVTWAENQLIQAEAKFKLTGAAAALPHVNAVRQSVGMAALPDVTFDDVMTEKYIAMFQNITVWADFKRTCIPALKTFGTATEVPGRLPYGSAERTNNPNLPLPSAYPTGTTGAGKVRNWNDPNACPVAP
ncbi:MAG TPA: SusD/RagB family nutrient-binding outer membrane lipoprotein [Longimicrobiales bacterium]|nr:SusD/RagB family nutrient-binding outer membrane lipoprotein [Longimicrobiales bacterium]